MTFPTVVNSGAANSGANTTSWTFNFGFTATSGNLLILCVVSDSTTGIDSFTSPSSWTLLDNDTSSFEVTMSTWKRISDGTETGVTIGLAVSQGMAATIHEFSGHNGLTDVEAAAQSTGADSSPNPPNLDPAGWGTEDTAWIAYCGWDSNPGLSSYPTNFTANQRSSEWNNATDGVGVATAVRANLQQASENPGTFSIGSSQEWVAGTIAIRPSADDPSSASSASSPSSASSLSSASSASSNSSSSPSSASSNSSSSASSISTSSSSVSTSSSSGVGSGEYQQVSATSSVKTAAAFTIPADCYFVEITADTQEVRYTMDNATSPTQTSGMRFLVGGRSKTFSIEDFIRIKFVRGAGSDGVLNVHFLTDL